MLTQAMALSITRLLPRLLPVDGGRRLSILVYHRVLPQSDYLRPGVPTVSEFDWQMELVSKYFTPLSLSTALQLMSEDRLPSRSICVTFDDGYRDNLHHALPILKKWKVPATVFVASGFLNGGRMWNDTIIETIRNLSGDDLDLESFGMGRYPIARPEQRLMACEKVIKELKHLPYRERQEHVDRLAGLVEASRLPDDLMLNTLELQALSNELVEIGNHTVNHPVLTSLGSDAIEWELRQNNRDLEDIIQKPIRYFAYPNGQPGKDFTEAHSRLVRSLGFQGAVTTSWGVSDKKTNPWQLPRFTPWDNTPWQFALRLVMNMKNLQTNLLC